MNPLPNVRRTSVKRRIGIASLGLLFAASIWFFWPRQPDLRGFEPAAAARLETRMWRSYYERRYLALLFGLYRLARDQYGFSPCDSTRIAWYAGRAAAAFQPSRNRDEARAALPALERYFRVIAAGSSVSFSPVKAAREELEWWQQRRENKPWLEYAKVVARVTATIYGVSEERVLAAARLRSEMMAERDRHRTTSMTNEDWQRIEDGLLRSWNELKQALR